VAFSSGTIALAWKQFSVAICALLIADVRPRSPPLEGR